MKILLINGSSRPNGCTYTALREVADTLENGGAETELLFLQRPYPGLHRLQDLSKNAGPLRVR